MTRYRSPSRFAACVLLLGLLSACPSSSKKKTGSIAKTGAAAALPSRVGSPGGAWYGVYARGNKVGHAHITLRRTTLAGNPVLELRSEMEMDATYGQMAVHLVDASSRYYEPSGNRRLLAIRRKQQQGPIRMETRVDRKGDKMIAVRRVSGREERKSLPATRETLDQSLFGVTRRELQPGMVIKGFLFFEDLMKEFPVTTRVLSRTTEYIGGLKLPLLNTQIDGLPMGIQLSGKATATGELVSAQVGPLVMRLEGKEAAKTKFARTDLLALSPTIAKLRNREAPAVRLRAKGLPAALVHNDDRQKFERASDGSYLITLRRLGRPAAGVPTIPVRDPKLAEYLKPTTALQSNHPEIIRVARKVVAAETDAYRAGMLLRDWVRRNMRSTWHRTLDALSALRAGGGMCYEFAHLLAALARASGIPARLAYGLVYAEIGSRALFGGHAWTELWVGEWIPFDATEPRGPARGPHLKLSNREVQSSLHALTTLRLSWE